ncbi:hypothetical protein VFPPC_15783 [Pochonia chlamydosporia 170]|uniref:Uncharacterized protein n=1 Tax=Pochonia chlamydosporia 170 TaxID=1380566 RepID=A0A179FR50_METCM|nr:hypothetical protein VFPPC_15783 [Pochonia chlamydosporia 170]OAQ68106.1 hypothetical protein VFPPC_15783 [Pochonia chlamydosporia 170]
MVAIKMPDEPAELDNVSMYGFGAIPNLEASLTTDEPLKRRLRPRREKADAASQPDLVLVNVRHRTSNSAALGSSSGHKPRTRKKPNRINKNTAAKARPGSKNLPIEILDSDKKAASSDK